MQSSSSILYGKCSTGVSYSTDLGIGCGNLVSPGVVNSSEEVKTQFYTREGLYKQMTISEYSRPTRTALTQTVSPISNSPVRVSFLRVPLNSPNDASKQDGEHNHMDEEAVDYEKCQYVERICFNVGREIYVFNYAGVNGASDLSNPVDKRVYKGTYPTCHDFNQETATPQSCSLLIGFSAGQIQLVDPYQKECQSQLFNEDRLIDKSAVTCVKWIPGQTSLFIASHVSGNLYVYNEDFGTSPNPPVYQLIKQGDGYSTYTCKSKIPRNPVQKWTIGSGGAINQFEFSDRNAEFLATAGQDGFLRVFNYRTMELTGFIKSYFGGLLCLAWSPDLQLIATGGEDDMLTIYSVPEKRVLCRGQGHKSWVSQVAFDPYTSILAKQRRNTENEDQISIDDQIGVSNGVLPNNRQSGKNSKPTKKCINKISPKTVETSGLSTQSGGLANGSGVEHSKSYSMEFDNHLQLPNGGGLSSLTPGHAISQSQMDFFNANALSWYNNASAGGCDGKKQSSATSPTTGNNTIAARACYRIGSVGHDTQLCLWDLADDLLLPNGSDSDGAGFETLTTTRQQHSFGGINGGGQPSSSTVTTMSNTTVISIGMTKSLGRGDIASTSEQASRRFRSDDSAVGDGGSHTATTSSQQQQHQMSTVKENKNKLKKLHRRGLSFGSKLTGYDRWSRNNVNSNSLNGVSTLSGNGDVGLPTGSATVNSNRRGEDTSTRIFGTAQCPRMDDVPVIEPLICKKVAHERLTVLHFREDCLVTACQEGLVCTWARPGKIQRIDAAVAASGTGSSSLSPLQNNNNHHRLFYPTMSNNNNNDCIETASEAMDTNVTCV